jgi:hypothetical protein
VARSSWKFLQFNQDDLYQYQLEYRLKKKYQEKQYRDYNKNYFKINNLNYMHTYGLYQGKVKLLWKSNIHCVNNILGNFLKTKKPFHFKKKKKK